MTVSRFAKREQLTDLPSMTLKRVHAYEKIPVPMKSCSP
jgi:hypothetical protein